MSNQKNSSRDFSYATDGRSYSFLSITDGQLSEIFVSQGKKQRQITHFSDQLVGLQLAEKELIRWKSYDGLEIEAVLTRPVGFVAGKRIPLYGVPMGAQPELIGRP